MKKWLVLAGGLLLLTTSACTRYQYAREIKMLSFDENVEKGTSVGPVRGADCVWHVLGYQLGGYPQLDKAMAGARTQSGESAADAIGQGEAKQSLRYINNASTEWDGFNAGIIGKRCLVVKGAGYK